MRRAKPRKSVAEALREMTNLGSLIPYLVDREEHDYRVREALERARDRRGSSLVCCIVHGMEDQCHDTFVERLKECTLRQCLGLRDTQPVRRYHVHFPTHADSREVLWERLRVQICDRFRSDPSTKVERLAQAIASAPCPRVIYSELATSTKLSSYGSLIDAYRTFWDQLLTDRLCHPTVVCLGVVYRRGVGHFRRWLATKQANRVRRELQLLEFGRYQRIVATILPEFETKSSSVSRGLFYIYNSLARFHAAQTGTGSQDNRDYITYSALGEAVLWTHEPAEVTRFARPVHDTPQRSVVLIDEIDKAPRDFPNDILNENEEMYFRVPELENLEIRANPNFRPIVVITSNSEKHLPDAFLRRCIYYHIQFPDRQRLEELVLAHLVDVMSLEDSFLSEALNLFMSLRSSTASLHKKPATGELLGWIIAMDRFRTID